MKTENVTVSDLLGLHCRLNGVSDSPRLDCQIILGNILNRPRSWLLANDEHPTEPVITDQFIALLERRREGEPLAYLTGIKEFWSLEVKVTRDTLIPRPETEILIEAALAYLPGEHRMIADLGTGSGAIAIALAIERPGWSVIATDTSYAALEVARENASRHQCRNIQFICTNWFEGIGDYVFDLIVANPPYVESGDPHLENLRYEPEQALISNDSGMSDLKEIIRTAPGKLQENGVLILEHGYNQQDAVYTELQRKGYQDIEPLRDLGGQPRSMVARAPSTGPTTYHPTTHRNDCHE